MIDAQPHSDVVLTYLMCDAPARVDLFPGFLGALKALTTDQGGDAARFWAQRAVSPLLDYSSLMKLRRFLAQSKTSGASGPRLRLAILGGPTTTQLRQFIEIFLAAEGIVSEIYESDYGLFRQEILTPGSGLDVFQPQVIFLATGGAMCRGFPPSTWAKM